MAWTRLIAVVTDADAETLSDALMACGALSAGIEPNLKDGHPETEVFGEPDLPPPALWPHCLVDALIPLDINADDLMRQAVTLAGLPEIPAYQSDALADQDWVRLTQSQFDPIQAAPGLWVVPTWHAPPDPDALNIRLDPGQAFGTGSHATTRLCLSWLVDHSPGGLKILDYGCGSGILAIAAKMLEATEVTGIDIDPAAVAAATENARRNRVEIRFGLPGELAPSQQYDGVMANILAAPLAVLAPLLLRHLRPGGWLTLSGILSRQAEMVKQAYHPACTLMVYGQTEDWVCLSGRKH